MTAIHVCEQLAQSRFMQTKLPGI